MKRFVIVCALALLLAFALAMAGCLRPLRKPAAAPQDTDGAGGEGKSEDGQPSADT